MIPLGRSEHLILARQAGRAPSPHNIQPARWRFVDAGSYGRVELHECTSRWLRVGDPSGRDNQIALGAAWEGMALALSELSFGLGETQVHDAAPIPPAGAAHRKIRSADIVPGNGPDPLSAYVGQRRSFRGSFPAADSEQLEKLFALAAASNFASFIGARAAIDKIALLYDQAAAHGLRNPLFARELYQWMRFSAAAPDWKRDGLSTDCMALSSLETLVARFALLPAVVRVLCTLKLEGMLVSEAAKVKSAAALMVLHAPQEEAPFETGRRFYRFWLELTRAGFCGVPMSALSDSPEHAAQLLQDFPLPAGRRLVNVLRVGPRPAEPIAVSARLPTEELLIS